MDINISSSVAETSNNQDIGYAIQKKSQDIDKATATQLIDSVKSPASIPNLPGHLGNTINTTA